MRKLVAHNTQVPKFIPPTEKKKKTNKILKFGNPRGVFPEGGVNAYNQVRDTFNIEQVYSAVRLLNSLLQQVPFCSPKSREIFKSFHFCFIWPE